MADFETEDMNAAELARRAQDDTYMAELEADPDFHLAQALGCAEVALERIVKDESWFSHPPFGAYNKFLITTLVVDSLKDAIDG